MNKKEVKSEIQDIITRAESEITSDEIYDQLKAQIDPGRTQETIRSYIRELVNDSALIGSSSKGYFKISTKQHAQKAISYLENRIPDLQE